MKKYILAIDAGTTGITVLLFDNNAKIVKRTYSEFNQIYPKPGWVEHDPLEIWNTTRKLLHEIIENIDPKSIASIGITNQRETAVVWNRLTSIPIYNAIVWQCKRTSEDCEELILNGYSDKFKLKTGLIIDSYFSGTKINWILNNVSNAHDMAKRGELAFGTIDSWLIWNLTNGQSHLTDHTNASRTLVYNIDDKSWDTELLDILDIPIQMLPEIKNSSDDFGLTNKSIFGVEIPISGVAGDQQSALYGQLAFEEGMIKCTYGTGCFMLTNTGENRINSQNGLLTTIACDAWGKPVYSIEGSVFIGGAVIQWLRDELKLINNAAETEEIAKNIDSTNGVYIVPAFIGLGAPYWDMNSRGTISGITRGTNSSHLVRAALESIAYQVNDLLAAIQLDIGSKSSILHVDGGASQNDFLMQFQADILNIKIRRPENIETTALGVALLAGLFVKFWDSPDDFINIVKTNKSFVSSISSKNRSLLLSGWKEAISKTLTKELE
jgi:glycerol kinase